MKMLHKIAIDALKQRNNVWFRGCTIPIYDEHDKIQTGTVIHRAFINDAAYIAANEEMAGYFKKLYHNIRFNGKFDGAANNTRMAYSRLRLNAFYITDNLIDPALNNTIVYLIEPDNSFNFNMRAEVAEHERYSKKMEEWSDNKIEDFIDSNKFSINDGIAVLNNSRHTTSQYSKFLRQKQFNTYDVKKNREFAITFSYKEEYLKRDVNMEISEDIINLGFDTFELMKEYVIALKNVMTISSIEQIASAMENELIHSPKDIFIDSIDDLDLL